MQLLQDGEQVHPKSVYHFMVFRISKLSKLMKIDDSYEKINGGRFAEERKYHI